MTYSIETITTLVGAHRIGSTEAHIDWLLTDSRSLVFPESSLFFAIRTQKNDGHRYIAELYRRGVRSFVVSQVPENPEPDANYLKVPSPLKALQRLAERHREEFDISVVGITGSNGKTIVKEWLYQLLAPDFNITRSPRSWNSQIGVPLSVWRLKEQTQIGIFEAGISGRSDDSPRFCPRRELCQSSGEMLREAAPLPPCKGACLQRRRRDDQRLRRPKRLQGAADRVARG